MSLVNFNTNSKAPAFKKPQAVQPKTSKPSLFTPAPSVETAGSVASAATSTSFVA